jgi:hypothetical protein
MSTSNPKGELFRPHDWHLEDRNPRR